MPTVSSLPIPAKRANLLVGEFTRSQRALFIGAGCSTGTGVPSTTQLRDRLFVALNGNSNPPTGTLGELADEIMERNPADLYHESGMALWATCEPNEIHRLIGILCGESLVQLVVTTNYDELIENCMQMDLGIEMNSRILRQEDFRYVRNDLPIVVKLHGTASIPASVLMGNNQFRNWEHGWFRGQLKSMFRQHSFVFLGYSSSDPHINKAFEAVTKRSGQNPVWVLRNRNPEIDAFLRWLKVTKENQIPSDAHDFLSFVRYKCVVSKLMSAKTESVIPSINNHIRDSPFRNQSLRLIDSVISGFAQDTSAADYLKIFLAKLEKRYTAILKNSDAVCALITWMSIIGTGLSQAFPSSEIEICSNGFHLGVQVGATHFGVIFVRGNNKSSDEAVGLIRQWLLGSSSIEEAKLPPIQPNTSDLVSPNKLLIVVVENEQDVERDLTIPLHPRFYKDKIETINAICLGSRECQALLQSNTENFAGWLRECLSQ